MDCLPKADVNGQYEISDHICDRCAVPYEAKRKQVYGKRIRGKMRYGRMWERERAHTEATFLVNPERLRDLESDYAYRLNRMLSLFRLPENLPTWHEWVVIEHKGVKVFYAGYKREDSWMTLHPEPAFRTNGHGKECFHPSSLPTYERCAEQARVAYKERNPDYPHWKLDGLALQMVAVRPAIMDAINLGALTQTGIAPNDSPLWLAPIPAR